MKVRPQELEKIRDLLSSEYRSALSARREFIFYILVADRIISSGANSPYMNP